MSRPLRIEYPGAWYHVMNRGRRSEKIFLNEKDYHTFINLLIEACKLWKVNTSAYTLMPNHYHLLINTTEGNLSRFMRHIDGVYTQRFNKNHKCEGQLFKGRYKSILVDGDSYLLQLLCYIHRNSLRAEIAKDMDDFQWSSHRGYVSESKDYDWLYKEFILLILSEDKREWINKYRNFINQEDKKEVIKVLDSKKWPTILGSEEFISKIKKRFFKQKENKEIPESYDLSPEIKQIKKVVCLFYGVNDEILHKSIRGSFNEPRNIAIFLSRKLRNNTLEEIGREFSLHRYSSVSTVLIRIKEQLKNNLRLQKKIKKIEAMIDKSQQ
jgi:REP element-mobilizing transposase RayT